MNLYQNIGLFGGTFDPPHNAHLLVAEQILKKFELSHIYFVPAYTSPHKTHLQSECSYEDRVQMLTEALEGKENISISKFEIHRPKISYSIETILHYKKISPKNTKLYFIIGNDAFLKISTWHEPKSLFSNCNFIVVNRPGFPMQDIQEVLKNTPLQKEFSKDEFSTNNIRIYRHFTGNAVYYCGDIMIDISATRIREKIKNHESIKAFVPESVLRYIEMH